MNHSSQSAADLQTVDALRYALMRRLAPVLRHELVGTLQPLSLVCQVLRHKLNAASPDAAVLAETAERATVLVRNVSTASNDVMSWLGTDSGAAVPVGHCIAQCISALHTSLGFHGFVLRDESHALTTPVRHLATREVLTAMLLTCADHADGRSEIAVRAQAVAEGVEITLALQAGANPSRADLGAYRALYWPEVEALARFHGMRIAHAATGSVVLTVAAQAAARAA